MRSLMLLIATFLLLFPAVAQTTKPRPANAKPRTATTSKPGPAPKRDAGPDAKKPDEKAAWDAAAATPGVPEKLVALRKFNKAYPKSAHRTEAFALIAKASLESANSKLDVGDVTGAADILNEAVAETPKPIAEVLWTDVFSKVPPNLYFRGARDEAYGVARALEEKIEGNSAQTLALANFYLTVEDGASARKLVERVIASGPASPAAYQVLGLANRVAFQLEDSAAAYAKALALDPASLSAKRGLAEANRSLGKSDEAAELYRQILEKDDASIPARTGLALALFDAGKRADAEAEMSKALASNAGNVILLAGAAYWYAAHGEADKAIDLAQKAIAADPRYIWSHIALARGYLLQKRAAEAEKTLFKAQMYGNFPTLQYELASARLAAGYYRDAADELSKSFAIKDGIVSAELGGRTHREGKDITEVIGLERRASIFTPGAADDAENAGRLVALLELRQTLQSAEPNADAAAAAADRFVSGDDKMQAFRQLYAARELLDKKAALAKVVDLTKAASLGVDAAIEAPGAPTALMAAEIYEVRTESARRGEYVNVPDIPKNMMSAVLRGEIEGLAGWAQFQTGNAEESVVRLKRAVIVLPADSAWWRTNMWRLGTALAATGKDAEALDAYIKVYKGTGQPDNIRYAMIEGVYKRLNGSLDGLETKIGPSPGRIVQQKRAAEPAGTSAVQPTGDAASPSVPEKVDTPPVPVPSVPSATPDATLSSPATKLPSSTETGLNGVKPCTLVPSEESPTLAGSGAELSLMIGTDSEVSLDDLSASTSSLADISIKREIIPGIRSKAIFVLRSNSGKPGVYNILFELPCGRREIAVTVK